MSDSSNLNDLPVEVVKLILAQLSIQFNNTPRLLTLLDLSHRSMRSLTDLPSLWRELDVSFSHLTVAANKSLPQLLRRRGAMVRHLALSGAPTVDPIMLLNLCPSLESLDLSSVPLLPPTMCQPLTAPKNPNLTYLSLAKCKIRDNDTLETLLGHFPSLRYLMVCELAINFALLAVSPSVEVIDIANCSGITSTTCTEWFTRMPKLRTVFASAVDMKKLQEPFKARPDVQIRPGLYDLITLHSSAANQEVWVQSWVSTIESGAAKIAAGREAWESNLLFHLLRQKWIDFNNKLHLQAIDALLSVREDHRREWAQMRLIMYDKSRAKYWNVAGLCADNGEPLAFIFMVNKFGHAFHMMDLLYYLGLKMPSRRCLEWTLSHFTAEELSLEACVWVLLEGWTNATGSLYKAEQNARQFLEVLLKYSPTFDPRLFYSIGDFSGIGWSLISATLHTIEVDLSEFWAPTRLLTQAFNERHSMYVDECIAELFKHNVKVSNEELRERNGVYPPVIFMALDYKVADLELVYKHGGDPNLVWSGKSVLQTLFEKRLDSVNLDSLNYLLSIADITPLREIKAHEIVMSKKQVGMPMCTDFLRLLAKHNYTKGITPSKWDPSRFLGIRDDYELNLATKLGFIEAQPS